MAVLTLLDAKVGQLIKLLLLFRGKLIVVRPDGVSADQFAVIHIDPIGDLIRVDRNEVAGCHPVDLYRGVVYPAVKTVPAVSQVGKPEVFYLVALSEGLFHFKILLPRRRMLQGGDEGTDGSPRLENRSMHPGMIARDIERFGLGAWPFEFLPDGMISNGVVQGDPAKNQCPG